MKDRDASRKELTARRKKLEVEAETAYQRGQGKYLELEKISATRLKTLQEQAERIIALEHKNGELEQVTLSIELCAFCILRSYLTCIYDYRLRKLKPTNRISALPAKNTNAEQLLALVCRLPPPGIKSGEE